MQEGSAWDFTEKVIDYLNKIYVTMSLLNKCTMYTNVMQNMINRGWLT